MIAGIHHATLLTSDLAKSRAFYEGVLGLALAQDRPQMSFDGVWYDLASNPEAGLQRPAHGGRDRHIALAVKELSALKARLEAAGIACTVSQSGRRALFCRDPDQNALEFIEVV